MPAPGHRQPPITLHFTPNQLHALTRFIASQQSRYIGKLYDPELNHLVSANRKIIAAYEAAFPKGAMPDVHDGDADDAG